MNRPKQ